MRVARLLGLVAFLSVALCVVTASEAHASGPVSLRWSAPEDCPTGDDVLTEVNRLLGDRASSDDGVLDVVAEVTRKDDGTYLVRLEIPSADGPRSREVSAVSCVALGQATALILAMMVDPEAALTAPPPPDSSGPTSGGQPDPKHTESAPAEPKPGPVETPRQPLPAPVPPASSVPKAPNSPPPPKKAAKVPLRFSFSGSASFIADFGSLPDPTIGAGLALGGFFGRLNVETGGAYFLTKPKALPNLPNARADVSLAAFHLAIGYAFRPLPYLEVVPRIRAEVGVFQAASFGVSDVGEGAARSFSMGGGVVLSLRLFRYFRAKVGLDGIAWLAYPQFIVTGLGVVHEPSTFVLRPSLGFEVRR